MSPAKKQIVSDFVVPETKRLHLSGDRWIDVKKHLTAGEDYAMRTYGMGSFTAEGSKEKKSTDEARKTEVSVNWMHLQLGQVMAYLVDWNLVGADGKQVVVSLDAVKALRKERFEEINAKIEEHMAEMSEEEANPTHETGASAISA